MKFKELLEIYREKRKTMTNTKIALEWGISTQHLTYYIHRGQTHPDAIVPKDRNLT